MKRITYLDGLRGLAALQVVLAHCMVAFAPATTYHGPFRLIWDGEFAVFLFFLMSGFVLTFSFEREPLALAASSARRIVRLGFPLAASALLCCLAASTFPELHFAAARLSGSKWLADMMPADSFHALLDAAGVGMLIGYRDTGLFQQLGTLPWSLFAASDPPQWSLHIEFWGSLLLIALVCCRYVSRDLYAAAVAAIALAVGTNALILFLAGNLIAYAVRTRWIAEVLTARAAAAIATAVLIAGLVLDYGDKLPLLWRLDHLHVSGLLVTSHQFSHFSKEVGATLTFVAIFALPGVQAFLMTRAIAWLGRMSFSVYLLHHAVLLTLGSWLYIELLPQGRAVAVLAASGAVIVGTLAGAIAFERWVDRLAIRMSRSTMTIHPEPSKRLAAPQAVGCYRLEWLCSNCDHQTRCPVRVIT
jgi:peptidoglycan/LPS O-acetylase OafA/YrhL